MGVFWKTPIELKFEVEEATAQDKHSTISFRALPPARIHEAVGCPKWNFCQLITANGGRKLYRDLAKMEKI